MTETVEAPKAEEPVKNPIEKSVDITVKAADLQAGTQAELKRLAKKAKMPGFRPGHVPQKMVEAMYGQEAYAKTLNALIDAEFRKAVEEGKFNVVGQADCQPKEGAEGEDLQFTLTFEVYPEIKTPDFSDVELKRYNCPVTDAEIDKTVEIIVKQRATYEAEEGRKAAAEDRVTINFKGTKDGEAFAGGSADGFVFVLGEGRMLPEFEAAVTGLAAGDKKSFDLTFPETYGNADLAGKAVVFEVECVKVEAPKYPAVDEEFAKSLGMDSVEALRKEVGDNLAREVKARLLARTKNEVLEAVLAKCDFTVPKALVTQEQERMAHEVAIDMAARMGAKSKDAKLPLELFAEGALRQVRLGMMMSTIIGENEINVSRDDVLAHVKELASAYQEPEAMVDWTMNDRERFAQTANVVLENKAIEFILGKAKTTEETVEFDKLMGRGE